MKGPSKKWRESTLRDVMRFPAGFGRTRTGSKTKYDGPIVDAETAFYIYESHGLDTMDKCSDTDGLIELLQRKDAMNLSIAQWKEEIKSVDVSDKNARGFIYAMLGSLCGGFPSGEFPWAFLKKVGVVFLAIARLRMIKNES